ncbi:MAG: methyltransferase [Candidatus Marinimicrobia bacterium]|nr:methyltransferase [Candidatus Neomarinimicrobiota bacterium]
MPLPKPEPKREWSEGLSNEAVLLVETLEKSGSLGTVVDCGAGEGRHSVFASRKGAEKVIAIEKDPEQVVVLRGKKKEDGLSNLEVIEEDVL